MEHTTKQARTAARQINRAMDAADAGETVEWDQDVNNVDGANSSHNVVVFTDGSAMKWVADNAGGWQVVTREQVHACGVVTRAVNGRMVSTKVR